MHTPDQKPRNRLWTLFTSMLTISSFTFGGGFVIVTLMKRRFVDELGWMDEDEMLDIAAMAGACLGAAAARLPLLLDGFISTVAALAAVRLCPAAEAPLLASHRSAEPAGQMLLDALGLSPLLCAGLRLGEGTGALAALPLFDMAMAMYGGAEFSSYGMDAYTPQN